MFIYIFSLISEKTKEFINKRIIIFQLVLKIFFMLISLLKRLEREQKFLENISFEYI